MKVRKVARKVLTLAGVKQFKPRGYDLFYDLKQIIPNPSVVMDIGANVGQSAATYLANFPTAKVYSFEPVEATFAEMLKRVGSNHQGRFFPVQIAFGSAPGRVRMNTGEGTSDMFHIAEDGNEEVDLTTVDAFIADIPFVDFIKIDAEGFDLEVLKGAVESLKAKKIGAIQVEAGLNPTNKRHIPLETFKTFLEAHEYYLFGIYDQIFEFPTNEPHLRRCNPVFIPRAAAKHQVA